MRVEIYNVYELLKYNDGVVIEEKLAKKCRAAAEEYHKKPWKKLYAEGFRTKLTVRKRDVTMNEIDIKHELAKATATAKNINEKVKSMQKFKGGAGQLLLDASNLANKKVSQLQNELVKIQQTGVR